MIEKCIVCGGMKFGQVMKIKDHLVSRKTFTLVECKRCSFRFVKDVPPATEAGEYYETEEYVEHSDSAEGVVNRVYHVARSWMLRHKRNLVSNSTLPKTILDIGTGTGYFLNHMKLHGYQTYGLEISDRARTFGQDEFGLDIRRPQALYQDDFPRDITTVTFWHVLEHIYNVGDVMDRLLDILHPDGQVIVALPNYHCHEAKVYGDYWNGYDVPRHIWHFDKKTFTQFAERHGYQVSKTTILPLDPYYNCLISESYRGRKFENAWMPVRGSISLAKGLLRHDRASSIVYFLSKKSS